MTFYVIICGLNVFIYVSGSNNGLKACQDFVCDILESDEAHSGSYDCYGAKWAASLSCTFYSCLFGAISTIFAVLWRPSDDRKNKRDDEDDYLQMNATNTEVNS